jgi:hypothetical protein
LKAYLAKGLFHGNFAIFLLIPSIFH